jgi:hypothetical protein
VARAAAHVMDGLIDIARHGIAVKAAHWSLAQMARIEREPMTRRFTTYSARSK